MPTVWFNGRLTDSSQAHTSALDRGLTWGWGLFETLRAYGGRPWAFEDHMERLKRGSDLLDLPVPTPDLVRQAVDATISANSLVDCGVRVTVTASAGPPDPHADPEGPPNVLVTAWPLRDYSVLYSKGAALIGLRGWGRPLAGVKSTSYAVSVAGRVAARRAGADDALFLESDGTVLETTGSNLMVMSTGVLRTPPPGDVLPGVTRRTVIEVAASLGIETVEGPVHVDELLEADEVLLTSSLREVYSASRLDGKALPTGPWAARLRKAFGDHVRSR